ncbi:Arm DNA-binding domain-containing protein [Pectobacterium carotovorum]|uniref:Arm DNA-binding domain-containing protein n=1 Tax=Pectobacterium carotovorum TaxID=554 RepID=UPI002B0562A8|nr:Arm DNA-binding domain-containing protein [Pectobacterium carotovorum]
MPLNARQIETAKPQDKEYKLTDGSGLYLLIKPNGAKYWRLKYRVAGKEKKLSIGVYPNISLAEALAMVRALNKMTNAGMPESVRIV